MAKIYSFLPDGYQDLIVKSESMDEIMADKIVSLVSNIKYIRHRDIWDLYWLQRQGATLNMNYVLRKFQDYQVISWKEKVKNTINILQQVVFGSDFSEQISRFLPVDVQKRTLKKNKFLIVLIQENSILLNAVLQQAG